ncbi:protein MATERNALLY EXPRESSED GENE 1-like [Miscanthus floridulus]|uniref:protein MATERNALLY EXPRESSED GENE 1-like n=1 Tax=Miscanthus floridulus TaxID=154761 RepID=UPI00345AEF93
MVNYTRRVDALVFFSLLLLGYFAAHAQGNVGAPAPAVDGIMQTRAQCRQVLFPCKDNKCYCCIGGGTRRCFATQAGCRHACP